MRLGTAGQIDRARLLVSVLLFTAAVGSVPRSYAQETPERIEPDRVQQPLREEESGRRQLLYRTMVVEVPTKEVQAIIDQWRLIGGSRSNTQNTSSAQATTTTVIPAASAASTTAAEIRLATGLSDVLIDEILRAGTIISSPEVFGEDGEEVNLRVGQDLQFVAAYKPAKDENGKATAMQPVPGTIHEGIQLGLTGVFREDQESVHLEFNLTNTQLKEEKSFTYESKGGPLTVQQPEVASMTIQTSCNAPLHKTIALYSGPVIRESLVERRAPLIGRLPYVGKAFTRTVKWTESIATIILIRCEER